jgi:hypothetical protein
MEKSKHISEAWSYLTLIFEDDHEFCKTYKTLERVFKEEASSGLL